MRSISLLNRKKSPRKRGCPRYGRDGEWECLEPYTRFQYREEMSGAATCPNYAQTPAIAERGRLCASIKHGIVIDTHLVRTWVSEKANVVSEINRRQLSVVRSAGNKRSWNIKPPSAVIGSGGLPYGYMCAAIDAVNTTWQLGSEHAVILTRKTGKHKHLNRHCPHGFGAFPQVPRCRTCRTCRRMR